ncbi:MAG: hypothetical protein ACK53Y_17440, partial [bacterium]
ACMVLVARITFRLRSSRRQPLEMDPFRSTFSDEFIVEIDNFNSSRVLLKSKFTTRFIVLTRLSSNEKL